MDFAPASLEENCLHEIFTISHFAGSNQWLALPQLLCTARLHEVMHAVGPKVEFVVLTSIMTSSHQAQFGGAASDVF